MSNGTQSNRPAWLSVVFALLAGGWVGAFLLPSRETPVAALPAKASERLAESDPPPGPDAEALQREARLLAPLAEHLGRGRPTDANEIEAIKAALGQTRLDFLFVTIADPRDSVIGYRFDLQLDALHKALSVDGYVFDHYYVPWADAAKERWRDEPGVLLYRRTGKTGKTELLVLLLVGEQPTSGIHRRAFDAGLVLVRELMPDMPRIMIAGTTLTGSASSLASAIQAARQEEPRLTFTVISGGAIGIDRAAFLETALAPAPNGNANAGPTADDADGLADGRSAAAEGESEDQGRPTVEFGTTVMHVNDVRQALIEYVAARSPQRPKIAWLSETASGFGKAAAPVKASEKAASESAAKEAENESAKQSLADVVVVPYPMTIAHVRASYDESRAAQQRQAPRLGDDRYRVRLGLDDIAGARDLPQLFTPQMTAPSNELILGQILAMIRRDDIRYVGISTSDTRDAIFLSQFIKQHYPTCQIMLVSSDLVHLHPAYRQAMAGTLVASSYPLLPDALEWYEPRSPAQRSIVLSHQSMYGTYNAVRMLRHLQQGASDDTPRSLSDLRLDAETALVGYRPFPPPPGTNAAEETYGPPIWISMIGNDGIWPLTVWRPKKADDYTVKVHWQRSSDGGEGTNAASPPTPVASRFARGATIGYLGWLTLALVVLGATCVDLGADWCQPLRLGHPSGRELPIRPHWFLGGILLALWLSLNGLAALALVGLHSAGEMLAVHSPVWWWTLLLVVLYVAAATAILGAALRAFTRDRLWPWAPWLTGAVIQAAVLLAFWWDLIARASQPLGRENLALWFHYTFECFNGVSLAVPLALAALAIVALCYGLLNQYRLTEQHFVPRPRFGSEATVEDAVVKEQLVFPIAARVRTQRMPITVLLSAAAIALWFGWIGWQTVAMDAYLAIFAAMLVLLLVACVLWGLRMIKTTMVLRQLLRDLDEFFHRIELPEEISPRSALKAWEAIFQRRPKLRHERGMFFHSGRPHRDAALQREQLEQRCRQLEAALADANAPPSAYDELVQAKEDLYAAWVEQYAIQFLAHLRTLRRWLFVAAILIFLAATSYPFNTAQYLRLTTALMLGVLGAFVVYAYVVLDRHPLLSLIVGTTPFEFRLDWTFLRTTVPIVAIAAITLLSQTFPEAWQWLRAVVEPVLRPPP